MLVASLGIGHLFNSLGRSISPLGLGAILLAVVALVAYAVVWLMSRYRRPSLSALLEPYKMAPAAPEAAVIATPVITLPLLKRLAGGVQGPLSLTGWGRWLDGMLERAGSPLRLGELVTIWGIGGIIFLALGWLLAGLVGLVIVLVLVLVVPPGVLQMFVDRRSKLFATQLPDVLKLTASSLRA
ncbi:MAG TPA: hypothetical protein VMS00_05410, partial [Acidimicrobiales bacterium]|nr:hypothetical protein [Acidimicrobiales bacterium]